MGEEKSEESKRIWSEEFKHEAIKGGEKKWKNNNEMIKNKKKFLHLFQKKWNKIKSIKNKLLKQIKNKRKAFWKKKWREVLPKKKKKFPLKNWKEKKKITNSLKYQSKYKKIIFQLKK